MLDSPFCYVVNVLRYATKVALIGTLKPVAADTCCKVGLAS